MDTLTIAPAASREAAEATEPDDGGRRDAGVAARDHTAAPAEDLRLARNGDEAAIARLFDLHAPVVLSICRARLDGSEAPGTEADDAAQETFIRAFERLDRVVDASKFRPWLYAIARRVCSERRRALRRRRKHEGDAMVMNAMMAQRGGRDVEHEERAARREMLDRISGAMRHLTARERLAIHLHYLDPDPIAAARDALGLSRSGFYKLLTRARERLRGVLTVDAKA